ncbi:MAG: carboxypeptidase regulatory-like domain-containing protein, partial [Planctomycetes bacterium]|nr:carboxypeptidase regulatory-like domain-containing protein [Planctomycetota bacterium]
SADTGGSLVPQLGARHGVTAADGAVRIAGLERGAATVEAMAKARTSARAEVVLDEAERAGEVRLTLREGGVVTGKVLSPDGTPLAGARVAHHPGGSLPIVGNLADQLGPENLAAAARAGVETEADGTFRLTGLDDDGEFLVVAAHQDYSASYRDGVHMGDEGVVVQLEAKAELVGRVVRDDTGAPLPDYTVNLLRTAFLVMRMPVRTEVVSAAEDGAFRVAGVATGDYTLQIEVPGFGSIEQGVTVGRGQTDVGELRVEASAWITGRVLAADGTPVPRAQVRKRQGGMSDNPMLAMFLGTGALAHTDQDGNFRLGPLSPGRLQLVASVTGHASGRSERLAVAAGAELDGVIITLTEGGSIRGRVHTGPGQFVDDFLLMAQEQATQASYGADIAADGSFVFEHLDPGQYVVQAMPNGLMRSFGAGSWRPGQGMKLGEMMRKVTDSIVSQRCTVRDGETSEVELDVGEIDDGALWTVRVEVGGELLQDGVLEAQSPATGRVRVAMLERGVGTFGGLPPGDYRLQVRSGMTMAPVGGAQMATLPAGRDTHTTTLSLPAGELRGRVVSAADGKPLRAALVRLYHDGHAERDDAVGMALSGNDGAFRFAGLLSGRYTLVAAEGPLGNTGTASRRTGLEVVAGVAGEPIELRAQPAASASVLVTADGGAPLAGATVLCVDGDGRPIGSLGLAVSGSDGRAWFGGLAGGAARVVGRFFCNDTATTEILQVDPSASTEFHLDLPRGARTTVQVFDRDGRQLGGATLTARWAGGPWLPTLLLEEGRGADGSIDLGRLGPGAWQFRVTHPAIGTVEAARTIGSEPSVTIVVAPQ